MTMDEDFENIVTKVVQMAQKWAQMTQLLKLHRIISKLVQNLFSSVLIMTMDEGFKSNVTKLVQMAQKVVQMTKNWNHTELSQNSYWTYFKHGDYEYEQRFGNYPMCQ